MTALNQNISNQILPQILSKLPHLRIVPKLPILVNSFNYYQLNYSFNGRFTTSDYFNYLAPLMGLRCKHPWSPRAFCIPFIPPFNVYLIVFNSAISIPRHFHLAGNSLQSLWIWRWKLKLVLTSEKANNAQILESKLNYLQCHCTIVFLLFFCSEIFIEKSFCCSLCDSVLCNLFFAIFGSQILFNFPP